MLEITCENLVLSVKYDSLNDGKPVLRDDIILVNQFCNSFVYYGFRLSNDPNLSNREYAEEVQKRIIGFMKEYSNGMIYKEWLKDKVKNTVSNGADFSYKVDGNHVVIDIGLEKSTFIIIKNFILAQMYLANMVAYQDNLVIAKDKQDMLSYFWSSIIHNLELNPDTGYDEFEKVCNINNVSHIK